METEKLYSPLEFFLRDKEDAQAGVYDDIHYWRDELSHEEAFGYLDAIELAMRRDRDRMDKARGMAEYVPDSLDNIVVSMFPSVEHHSDKLWCVADVVSSRSITPGEMGELTQWWSGQLSDGWGEGISQREIPVDRGDLYMETWMPNDSFFIDTEREFRQRLGLEMPEQQQTPAQAALHEPDIYDDAATAALREQLIERIDANLLSYFDDIHSNADLDITCMSSEIAAVTGAHCYLSEIHNFHASELRYLLQFKDPLSVVADKFQIAGMEDYSDVMWDIFDRQDALQGDYERMQNPADIDAMKQELFSRLDKNLSDYCESLMSVDKRELIGMAEEITSHYAAREYLKTAYDFKTGEVEYLLRYQDPLTLVADSWPGTLDGLVPMKDVVTDILEDRGSHGHYARVMDADSPAAKESARDASTEKRSVLEQIREAPKAPKEQRKDKPARDKSGLEL